MIYFYFKDKSKKYKNIPTTEMNLLMRIYGINISIIGIKKVERDISIINAIIITIDLLILYNIESLLLSLIMIFIITFVLIILCYTILAKTYDKLLYRR